MVKNLPAMPDLGLIPGFGRSSGEGNDFQYSCLENSVDRAAVHRVTKSQTPLSNGHFHFPITGGLSTSLSLAFFAVSDKNFHFLR